MTTSARQGLRARRRALRSRHRRYALFNLDAAPRDSVDPCCAFKDADDEGGDGRVEEGAPRLKGKHAQAHDIEIEIPVKEETFSVAVQQRKCRAYGKPSFASGGGDGGGNDNAEKSAGQRLSLNDYKKRIDQQESAAR